MEPICAKRIETTVGGALVSEASELKDEIAELEDDALQKRFAALFDDGQGVNARVALVNYCRSRNYHPSEMYVLCGRDLFHRLRDMIKRQEKLLDEYRIANKFLFDTACRLNGDKIVLPPADIIRRAADFQRLIRAKFGSTTAARRTAIQLLNLSGKQFSRLLTGIDVTDGLIERLEELPDHVVVRTPSGSTGRSKRGTSHRYEEINKLFSGIPKPKKFNRVRSTMTTDELSRIGEMLFGSDWIAPLAELIGYGEWQIKSLMKGGIPRDLSARRPQNTFAR